MTTEKKVSSAFVGAFVVLVLLATALMAVVVWRGVSAVRETAILVPVDGKEVSAVLTPGTLTIAFEYEGAPSTARIQVPKPVLNCSLHVKASDAVVPLKEVTAGMNSRLGTKTSVALLEAEVTAAEHLLQCRLAEAYSGPEFELTAGVDMASRLFSAAGPPVLLYLGFVAALVVVLVLKLRRK